MSLYFFNVIRKCAFSHAITVSIARSCIGGSALLRCATTFPLGLAFFLLLVVAVVVSFGAMNEIDIPFLVLPVSSRKH